MPTLCNCKTFDSIIKDVDKTRYVTIGADSSILLMVVVDMKIVMNWSRLDSTL